MPICITSCDCGIYGITVFAVRYLHAVYEMLLLDSASVVQSGERRRSLEATVADNTDLTTATGTINRRVMVQVR